eukprot:SM000265S09789  [mRNA]  locus=s265:144324:146011:- [translate_table: standard]
MDLGVLADVRGLRGAALAKLRRAQGLRRRLEGVGKLTTWRWLQAHVVDELEAAAGGVRACLAEVEEACAGLAGPGDGRGGGNGFAVYTCYPLAAFVAWAAEIAAMHRQELVVKEQLQLAMQPPACTAAAEADKGAAAGSAARSGAVAGRLSRDSLQVCLTAWIAEVHIDKRRVEEIMSILEEELQSAQQ